tara:strand:+ start:5267 stop:5962 length:696 start_codon:yes stop_codon:yes gene_type:complete
MTLIYIVEDSPELLSDALIWLNDDEFKCHGVTNAKELDELIASQSPDLVIIDWMLPGEDGLSIANRLRSSEENERMGLVFMTARRDIDDRLAGLEAADAYMTKPVDYRELKAVIRSVIRRLNPSSERNEPSWLLSDTGLTIQSPSQNTTHLTDRELIVLQVLLKNKEKIVSLKQINNVLEQSHPALEKSTLERLISRLRTKLKSISSDDENPIRSYRFTGYRLTLPITLVD